MTKGTIGVDISKDHLDAHRMSDGASLRFANDKNGHRAFLKWLGGETGARIVYEPTGPYHRTLERRLAQAGLALVKVNPRQARRFAEATGKLAKTDRLDAAMLARMGAMLALDARPVRSPILNDLKDLRRLNTKDFRGRLGVVSEWARRRRRAEQASDQQLHKVPSARTIARLMTTARDHLSKADTVMIAAIEAGVPLLVEARNLIADFHSMIRKKLADDLEPWIADAGKSLIASFAKGIIRDRAAVRAAITEPWSNGQTEGQITKLKLVKRQMYGRGKLDLLQARLIGAV